MTALSEIHDPIIWSLSGLAIATLLAGTSDSRRALRSAGLALLFLASLALLAGLALPHLLPMRSAVVHPDGTSEDPRVVSALLVGIAALAALAPAFVSLQLPPMAAIGLALPGLVLAGLLGAIASFEGLRQPMALAGIVAGAFGMGTALVLALRTRGGGRFGPALQSFGGSLLVVAAMLSLHGARSGVVAVPQGGVVDTLGMFVTLPAVAVPSEAVRNLTVAVISPRDSIVLHPSLRGEKRGEMRSVADARPFSGPIVVPVVLRERRSQAHETNWLKKGESVKAGDATVTFAKFRIEGRDTVRMYADLDVTTGAGTERVSPGVIATHQGEVPFAAVAKGLGPIAVAGIRADDGSVGLMLPKLAEGAMQRVALLDVRLRPALPVAWLGAALALLGFLLGFVRRADRPARG